MAITDYSAAIAEFLADSGRASFDLPHMTTGQRRNIKKLLEKYPDIRCESFGFGAERQLHLFKKIETINRSEAKTYHNNDTSMQSEVGSPDRSTTASSDTSCTSPDGSPSGGSPIAITRDVDLPELQVRNTFIHIESAPINDRAIQSMPHGMFRQCILAELTPRLITAPEPQTVQVYSKEKAASELEESLPLCVGSLVIVEGLVKVPAFNGCSAVIQGFDEESGRYTILLASADHCQQAKVKAGNLRVVLPCP